VRKGGRVRRARVKRSRAEGVENKKNCGQGTPGSRLRGGRTDVCFWIGREGSKRTLRKEGRKTRQVG